MSAPNGLPTAQNIASPSICEQCRSASIAQRGVYAQPNLNLRSARTCLWFCTAKGRYSAMERPHP
jgi:hypothetical protein